jgi:hypothetical protein
MEASALFTASSPESVLGERIAACYIGQAVSDLVAGRLDAAQQGFSGLRGRASVPDAALRFARQLYELVDAARELPPGERETALAPLAALVLQARLQVRFYDGVHPVVMDWGLWPEE